MIKLFQISNCDYASDIHYPMFPDGMDIEIFSFSALERSCNEAHLLSEREHVTAYVNNHPINFELIMYKTFLIFHIHTGLLIKKKIWNF